MYPHTMIKCETYIPTNRNEWCRILAIIYYPMYSHGWSQGVRVCKSNVRHKIRHFMMESYEWSEVGAFAATDQIDAVE